MCTPENSAIQKLPIMYYYYYYKLAFTHLQRGGGGGRHAPTHPTTTPKRFHVEYGTNDDIKVCFAETPDLFKVHSLSTLHFRCPSGVFPSKKDAGSLEGGCRKPRVGLEYVKGSFSLLSVFRWGTLVQKLSPPPYLRPPPLSGSAVSVHSAVKSGVSYRV